MIILGIDPGTTTTGFGLVKLIEKEITLIDYGLIETEKNGQMGKRFIRIHELMNEIFKKYNPDVMAIERLFFANNAKTAISVGQAQGIMYYSAEVFGIPVFEYAPGRIKKIISGDGRADKIMVQRAVRKILGARVRKKKGEKTHFDNSADALAVAICHIYEINS